MTHDQPAETGSTISGGNQLGAVLQGRDFRDVAIDVTVRAPAAAPIALAQLPPPVAGFTGRAAELAMMTRLLNPAAGARTVLVSAVAGLAGVGKTTLAIQAGHAARERGWFPGGVLFIDLHGYDKRLVEPAQALDALLRALGVAAEHIPPGTEARTGLYRSVLARISEPVLVIIDNASSEAQVRPLLPGAGLHRVVVTSRHTLGGLETRLLDVTILADAEGVALLEAALRAARPDDQRISSDRAAAARLVGICGGLPLALQIVAALLKADPARRLRELAGELGVERLRLERLRYDDGSGSNAPSVAAAFELSYRRLDETSARVFRALAVNPGPDLSTAAVAALADLPVNPAREVLAGLSRGHLVEASPAVAGRWRMHDLLRLYAQLLSDASADADSREQARDRLLDYYLRVAYAADQHLQALPGMAVPEIFSGRTDALDWFNVERPGLVAAVRMAADTGRNQVALDLPIVLAQYFDWRRRFDDWLATMIISLNAARSLGDRGKEALALNSLGMVQRQMRRFEEAITAHQDAAGIFRETGDRRGEGRAVDNLGADLREARRFGEAITACQDAAGIFRETGDRHSEGIALNGLGISLLEARRFGEAITACQDAVGIFRETGDRHSQGRAVTNLGTALRETGRFEEAIAMHRDGAAMFRETGDRYREGIALNNLGASLRGGAAV